MFKSLLLKLHSNTTLKTLCCCSHTDRSNGQVGYLKLSKEEKIRSSVKRVLLKYKYDLTALLHLSLIFGLICIIVVLIFNEIHLLLVSRIILLFIIFFLKCKISANNQIWVSMVRSGLERIMVWGKIVMTFRK